MIEYQDQIEQIAERNKQRLDGFDIHKGYQYWEKSATFVLAYPEPRRTGFAVVDPSNFEKGKYITVDVIKGSRAQFEKEQHRLQMVRLEMERIASNINALVARNGTYTAESLALLDTYNALRGQMVNPAVGYEFARIQEVDSFEGKRNIIILDRKLNYDPFPEGTCVWIVGFDKHYVNARLADKPESRWGIPDEEQVLAEQKGRLLGTVYPRENT